MKKNCKQEKSERDGVLTLGDVTTSLEKSVEESTRMEMKTKMIREINASERERECICELVSNY